MNDGLKTLFEYTVFHIGIYITMSAALVAADVFWRKKTIALPIAVFFLLIAGACGGSIASNVPNAAAQNASLQAYLADSPTLFFGWKADFLSIGILTQVEHGAFWIAILTLLFAFIWWRTVQGPNTNASGSELTTAAEILATTLRSQNDEFRALRTEIVANSIKTDMIPELQNRLTRLERAQETPHNKPMHPSGGSGVS
jgi:hypothetical protein